jgi:hypothetical protein
LQEPRRRGKLGFEPYEYPAKKPLLTRNELLIAAGVLVVGIVVTFVPLDDCVACAKDYRALEQDLRTAREKHQPPGVVAHYERSLLDWNFNYCRGHGRASLMDRLVQGSPPLPPPPKQSPLGKPAAH